MLVAYVSKLEATKVEALMTSVRFPIPQGTLDMLVLQQLPAGGPIFHKGEQGRDQAP
jgi:hypothetical protein